jgi:hypothetical protein
MGHDCRSGLPARSLCRIALGDACLPAFGRGLVSIVAVVSFDEVFVLDLPAPEVDFALMRGVAFAHTGQEHATHVPDRCQQGIRRPRWQLFD